MNDERLGAGLVFRWQGTNYEAVAEMQRQGHTVAVIDDGRVFDEAEAIMAGVDLNLLLVSHPDTPEQGVEILDLLRRSGTMDLILVTGNMPIPDVFAEQRARHAALMARLKVRKQ